MDDIINDFIAEASEGLEALDQKFVELEKNPGDTGLLNDIFRSIHTIKGAAGFLGFQQMVEVTHVTEDVLNKLRKGEMAVDAAIMDAILESVDLIKVILNNIRERNGRSEDTSGVISSLSGILSGNKADVQAAPAERPVQTTATADTREAEAKVAEPVPETEANIAESAPAAEAAEAPKASTVAEKVVEIPRPEAKTPEAKQQKEETGPKEKEKELSIRVDIDRLDMVLNLAGELVLSRNRLMRLGSKLSETAVEEDLVSHVDEAIAQLDLVTTDLQLAVMKMRMQPIAKVFNKFPRMVRDLARQNNKEVELVISGEETELDKTVIEELGDPLVHLIRNALDHGMETPEERVAAGKPRCGTVSLSAYQEGRNIIVSVAEDGRGMNPAHIKKSAVEKGLLTEDEAAKLSNKDALNLIFIPGFSTAKKVSNISGRGVGMDVVKTNITRINGAIDIDSEVGKGTRITFSLPLTLAIIQALTVNAGGEVYGIPLSTVIENIRVTDNDIKTVDGKEVIRIRDRVYPVVRLGALVSGNVSSYKSEWKYIVLIGIGEKRFGILVDRLHGQEEIVMKSMGEYLKGTEGIAGACITGDGNVILILDLAGLLQAAQRSYAF
ncbi:MAG: chemotaxis protein CheA [Deltaproteobacteria bacterium]|nr:chemotaxis protein CheA [Deltaproteobacteria bacterium]